MGTSQRTMARTALTLVLCLGVAAVLVTGAPIHTLRVKRSPGSFVKDVNAAAVRASTVMTRSHFRAGSHAVPMNGGYLTTGAYFMDITVGSLDQTFSVLVDAGSSNLALPSPSCNCGTSNATVYYDPAKSKTSAVPSCTSPFCQAVVRPGWVQPDRLPLWRGVVRRRQERRNLPLWDFLRWWVVGAWRLLGNRQGVPWRGVRVQRCGRRHHRAGLVFFQRQHGRLCRHHRLCLAV